MSFQSLRYTSNSLILLVAAFFFLCSMQTAYPAHAHPHIFIDCKLTIIFNSKGISGIKEKWVFDPMTTTMLMSSYDQNANAKLEQQEVKLLKKEMFNNLKNYHYFSHIKIDSQKMNVGYIQNFSATVQNDQLIYNFLVPCHVTATDNWKEINIAVFDPTYYSHVQLCEQNPAFIGVQKYQVQQNIRSEPEMAYYYGQIVPQVLQLKFKQKQ